MENKGFKARVKRNEIIFDETIRVNERKTRGKISK